ncbi:MAG: glycosyltransferase [Sandaracinaceae bacterium]|jgi:ceramide glucosyltransferase|nr:glycosyltransferase [Sandaracinaceae bacterium]
MGFISILLLVAVATAWAVLAVVSVWRVVAKTEVHTAKLESVSVLKPLCGVDEDLEANLRSFFEQDHPSFEIVFGIEGSRDPALALVTRMQNEFPHVRSTVVVHEGGFGINPKMSNLRAMLEHVSNDLILISDSNVRAPAHYLREMGGQMAEPGVGLVTNIFAGTGEESIGAALENLHLNSTIAAGVAASNEVLLHPAVVGKSMVFHRSHLEKLGGFATVADVLAEDYVIGRMFHEAGMHVRLARTPLQNVVRETSVKSFVMRQVRWGMIRVRLVPLAFVLEPLASPLFVACVCAMLGAPLISTFAWALLTTVLRDYAIWTLLRGRAGFLRAMPLVLVRDSLVFAAWVIAIFAKHVTWRGKRVRVSAGTRLYIERPAY